jgi:hypothetical protein
MPMPPLFYFLPGLQCQLLELILVTGLNRQCWKSSIRCDCPSSQRWQHIVPGCWYCLDRTHSAIKIMLSLISNSIYPWGGFLVYWRSWAPLCPTFWLENLPLRSTEFCKKLGGKVMKKELNYLASLSTSIYEHKVECVPVRLQMKTNYKAGLIWPSYHLSPSCPPLAGHFCPPPPLFHPLLAFHFTATNYFVSLSLLWQGCTTGQ